MQTWISSFKSSLLFALASLLLVATPHFGMASDVEVVNEDIVAATAKEQSHDFLSRLQIAFNSSKLIEPLVIGHEHIPPETLSTLQSLSPAKRDSYLKTRTSVLTNLFNILHTVKGPVGYGYVTKSKVVGFYNKIRGREQQIPLSKDAKAFEFIQTTLKAIDLKLAERSDTVAHSKYTTFSFTPSVGLAGAIKSDSAPKWGRFYGLVFAITHDRENSKTYFEILTHKEAVKEGFVVLAGAKVLLGLNLRTENDSIKRVGEIYYPPILPFAETVMKSQYGISLTTAISAPPAPITSAYFYTAEVEQRLLIRFDTSYMSPRFLAFKSREKFIDIYNRIKKTAGNLCKGHFTKD